MTRALLFFGCFIFSTYLCAQDSLGVETVNGKIFVVHRVSGGETLFSLSKRYNTTIKAILDYNPTADAGLEIGQILKVPYSPPQPVTVVAGAVQHTVGEGETLFSISRQYNVTVDDIRQWNNLPDNSISIGQVLTLHPAPATTPVQQSSSMVHTVMPGETLYSISKQNNVSVKDLMTWNSLQGVDIKVGQVLYLRQPDMSMTTTVDTSTQKTVPVDTGGQLTTTVVPEQAPTISISEEVKGSDEVTESGIAELIEGTDGNRKYLALHRTAPVGTILKVRNEMNNREVFVRVVGKIPDTALNDKVIIKISKSAYDRLGAIDPRFRVDVTYYK